MSRVLRKDFISLIQSVNKKDHTKIKKLSQTDRKTLRLILNKMRENPDINELDLDSQKIQSLEARLSGQKSPLPREGLIKRLFLRVVGGYTSSARLEEEISETIDQLYQYKAFDTKDNTKTRMLKAANNYGVDLLKLKDNLKEDSERERIRKAKALLGDIEAKTKDPDLLTRMGDEGRQALVTVRKEIESFIQELKPPVPPKALKPRLQQRKLRSNPESKTAQNVARVAQGRIPRQAPLAAKARPLPPTPGGPRVKKGSPSAQKIESHKEKFIQFYESGKPLKALRELESLRAATAARNANSSRMYARMKNNLGKLINNDIRRLEEEKKINGEEADRLREAAVRIGSSESLKEAEEVLTELENEPAVQLLQEKLANRLKEEREEIISETPKEQPVDLEAKVFQEKVTQPMESAEGLLVSTSTQEREEAVAIDPMAAPKTAPKPPQPSKIPEGLQEIVITMGSDEEEALTPEQLMMGYKRAATTEQLFAAITQAINDDSVPMEQKTALVAFCRNWASSGLFDNELDEMRGLLHTIAAEAQKQSAQSMDEENKDLATEANKLVKTIIYEGSQPVEVEHGPEKSVQHADFMKKVKRGNYRTEDINDYAAALTNHIIRIVRQTTMDEMYVPNTKPDFSTRAPHLNEVLNFQIKLSNKIQQEIVNATNNKERKNLYEFYAQVADTAWENGDVSTAGTIAGALGQTHCERTVKEEQGVKLNERKAKGKEKIENRIMSANQYNQALAEMRKEKPVIPLLDKLFGQIAASDEGNPKMRKTSDGSLRVNPEGMKIFAGQASNLKDFKKAEFIEQRREIDGLADTVENTQIMTSKELYELSLENFPRK